MIMSYTTLMAVLRRNFMEQKEALFHRFINSEMGVKAYERALRELEERHQRRCIDAFMEEMEKEESR